jgi:hypothetical protein
MQHKHNKSLPEPRRWGEQQPHGTPRPVTPASTLNDALCICWFPRHNPTLNSRMFSRMFLSRKLYYVLLLCNNNKTCDGLLDCACDVRCEHLLLMHGFAADGCVVSACVSVLITIKRIRITMDMSCILSIASLQDKDTAPQRHVSLHTMKAGAVLL